MRLHVQILLSAFLLMLFPGCQPEDIRFEDNPVPVYEGVPTVVVDAYLTRAYIDLIGREPLPQELEEERAALRAGDLESEAREALVDRLTGSASDTTYLAAHDRKAMEKLMARTKREMERAAKELAFMDAARMRDELFALQDAVKDWPA